MMTYITRGGKGRGDTSKESKATKSEGRCPEEGASRALMRQRDDDDVWWCGPFFLLIVASGILAWGLGKPVGPGTNRGVLPFR